MVVLRKLVWIWAAVEFNVAGVNRVKGCVGYMLAVNAAAKLKKSLIHIYQLFSRDHKLDQTGGQPTLIKKSKRVQIDALSPSRSVYNLLERFLTIHAF
jgi:hypothetical protein